MNQNLNINKIVFYIKLFIRNIFKNYLCVLRKKPSYINKIWHVGVYIWVKEFFWFYKFEKLFMKKKTEEGKIVGLNLMYPGLNKFFL